jgi:hypothetical protein
MKALLCLGLSVTTLLVAGSSARADGSVGYKRIDGGQFHENTRFGAGVTVGLPGLVGVGAAFNTFGALAPGLYLDGTFNVMPGVLGQDDASKHNFLGFHAMGAGRVGYGWRSRGVDDITFQVDQVGNVVTNFTAPVDVLSERAFYGVGRAWLGGLNSVAGGLGFHTGGHVDSTFIVDGYGEFKRRHYSSLNLEVLYAAGDLRGVGLAMTAEYRWTRIYWNFDAGYIFGQSDRYKSDALSRFWIMSNIGISFDVHVPPSGTREK